MKKKCESIHSSDSALLASYGLNPLTGEACSLGMRTLFDVNDAGKALLSEFFSASITFHDPWNSRVGEEPATGSIMLPRSVVNDLLAFAMITVSAMDVVVEDSMKIVHGYSYEFIDHHADMYGKSRGGFIQHLSDLYAGRVIYVRPAASAAGGSNRNVHAFSGREV